MRDPTVSRRTGGPGQVSEESAERQRTQVATPQRSHTEVQARLRRSLEAQHLLSDPRLWSET